MTTVRELIDHLHEWPEDMLVVVRGFDEFGYDDLRVVGTENIIATNSKYGPKYDGQIIAEREEQIILALLLD